MKIDFIIPGRVGWHGSRYKYSTFIESIEGIESKRYKEAHTQSAILDDPDIYGIWGDSYSTYELMLQHNKKYFLMEHDVKSLRAELHEKQLKHEKLMISNANKIIFTSPHHKNYIINKYNYPEEKTFILFLRPLKKDIIFKPLIKLPGKNIVYAGGLMPKSNQDGLYGYRSYTDIFKAFIKKGWNVHLYPVYNNPNEYKNIGCIVHNPLPDGIELYQELSQYTASLQIFNKTGVNDKSYNYAQLCYPNKLWLGLAAGIPTVGFQGGKGMSVYNNKWGIVLKNLNEINSIENRISKLDIITYRPFQIMEIQKNELRNFLMDVKQ